MARKRHEFSTAVEAQLAKWVDTGVASDMAFAMLAAQGVPHISRRTISRRMRELRVGMRVPQAVPIVPGEPPPLPQEPEDVPEGAPLAMYDYWINTTNRLAAIATANDDLEGFAKMARIANSLIIAKLKATPPDAPRPEDSPDTIALAKLAVARFHGLIDKVAGKVDV